jgi:uncharacterized protein (DUF885 family)
MRATRLGDHRFDDQLEDLSASARQASLERERATLEELPRRVRFEKLSRDGQIDFEILRHHLERSIYLEETFREFENDPRVYGEYLTESIYVLLTQSSLPKAVNLKNSLARMEKIPRIVDVARSTLRNPPRVKVETAIRQTEGAIHFYRQGLFALAGVEPGRNDLTDRAVAIATALERHLEFLRGEVLPRSTDDWRIGPTRFR